jgi:hypothetical protein
MVSAPRAIIVYGFNTKFGCILEEYDPAEFNFALGQIKKLAKDAATRWRANGWGNAQAYENDGKGWDLIK